MGVGRSKGWSGWVVRLVALILVVQGALLAFSQGSAADTLRRDQFGNVLCLASGNDHHDTTRSGNERHSDMMECCSLGCGMFAAVVVPPPGSAGPIDTRAPAARAAFISYADVVAGVAETPRNTRGPPAAA